MRNSSKNNGITSKSRFNKHIAQLSALDFEKRYSRPFRQDEAQQALPGIGTLAGLVVCYSGTSVKSKIELSPP